MVLGWYFATLAGMRKTYPTDLSDAEWNYIKPHMPAPKGHGRPRIHDLREILNAIFYLLKSGCQWRLLSHDFPRWPTVYHYFRQWRIDGTWERINRAIRKRLSPTVPPIGSHLLNTARRALIEESMGCEDDQATLQDA